MRIERSVAVDRAGRVGIQEMRYGNVPRGYVWARGIVSAISRGTERRIVEGASPLANERLDWTRRLFVPREESDKGDVKLGYQWVGVVEEVGEGVDSLRKGDRIVAREPHASCHMIRVGEAMVGQVPEGISSEAAAWLVLTEVALNGVHDAGAVPGERIAVVGMGVLGVLVVRILRRWGFEVFACGKAGVGLKRAEECGAVTVDVGAGNAVEAIKSTESGVDVAIETAGTISGLNMAIRAARIRGRIAALGFYGHADEEIVLSKEWHHNAVEMVSSRYDWGCGVRRRRWSEERLREAAWDLLRWGVADELTTYRYRLDECVRAYEEVMARPPSMLGGVFVYEERAR